MTGLPALTLHQPWASLVALGIETIETRSWPAPKSLIGNRMLIHASAKQPSPELFGTWETGKMVVRDDEGFWLDDHSTPPPQGFDPLPLGAILCSVRVVDCVPMVDERGGWGNGSAHLLVESGRLSLYKQVVTPFDGHTDVTDQLPYGDFAPGRFAWLLDDARRVDDECPWCGGAGNELLSMYRSCPVCDATGKCSGPIPAKGRQRVWKWTP